MAITRVGANTRISGDGAVVMGSQPINVQCVLWLATGLTNPICALSKADAQPTPDREEEEDSNGDRYAMIPLLVVAAAAAAIPGVVALEVVVGDHTRGKNAWNKALARTSRLSMILLMQALVVRIHL